MVPYMFNYKPTEGINSVILVELRIEKLAQLRIDRRIEWCLTRDNKTLEENAEWIDNFMLIEKELGKLVNTLNKDNRRKMLTVFYN